MPILKWKRPKTTTTLLVDRSVDTHFADKQSAHHTPNPIILTNYYAGQYDSLRAITYVMLFCRNDGLQGENLSARKMNLCIQLQRLSC